MARIGSLIALGLVLAACSGGGSATQADCYKTSVAYRTPGVCGYYPGYGWARVPVFTSIRNN